MNVLKENIEGDRCDIDRRGDAAAIPCGQPTGVCQNKVLVSDDISFHGALADGEFHCLKTLQTNFGIDTPRFLPRCPGQNCIHPEYIFSPASSTRAVLPKICFFSSSQFRTEETCLTAKLCKGHFG